jgi:spore maturation protein CgeB
MRILYVAMSDDYGDPARGPSFEEVNFKSALEGMGHELVPFDFVAETQGHGKRKMNRRLLAVAREAEPDLSFFVLFENEIDPETIKGVGAAGGPTVNWFTDDHWRFDRFTRYFAPAFDWSVTTDRDSLPRYRRIGYERAILSQWACNRYAYDWTGRELEYDVTFVGQRYGERPATVERLRAEGFDVRCWGFGWPEGRIEHDEMVRVFGASRVNLNLSAAFSPPRGIRTRIADLVRRQTQEPRKSQIKGRTFEVPGSGGFLLTDRVPHLKDYLTPGRDIGAFSSTDDLVRQVGWWLDQEQERARAAEAGYRRVRAEHTYDHRFAAIFARIGLDGPHSAADIGEPRLPVS